jgi:hypothetical protein
MQSVGASAVLAVVLVLPILNFYILWGEFSNRFHSRTRIFWSSLLLTVNLALSNFLLFYKKCSAAHVGELV